MGFFKNVLMRMRRRTTYVFPLVQVADHVEVFLALDGSGLMVSDVRTEDGYRAAYHPRDGLLTCAGCAHASAFHSWPGRPSGENPCITCVRNTEMVSVGERKDNYVTLATRHELIGLQLRLSLREQGTK